MNRKCIFFVIAIICIISLCACGKNDKDISETLVIESEIQNEKEDLSKVDNEDNQVNKELTIVEENGVNYIVTEDGEKYEAVNINHNYEESIQIAIIKKDSKFGIIATNNKFIDIVYDKIEIINDTLPLGPEFLGGFYVEKDGKFGLINPELEIIIPVELDKNLYGKYTFTNNGCIVKSGDKYGFITKDLENTIPYMYDDINIFSYDNSDFVPSIRCENYFETKINNKLGIVDINNNVILECKYDKIDCTGENLFRIAENKNISYIRIKDNKYEVINEDTNSEIFVKEDSFYIMEKEGKYGLYDEEGNVLLPCEYDEVRGCYGDSNYNNDYIKYRKNDKWGLYSLTLNKSIVSAEFDNIYNWLQGNYNLIVEKDGKFGVYNEEGNTIPIVYDAIVSIEVPDIDESFVVKKDGKLGKYDVNGNEILSVKYDGLFTEDYEGGHIVYIEADNKCYLIDENEEILKEYTKEEAEEICNNYSQVSRIMYADEKFENYGLIRNY